MAAAARAMCRGRGGRGEAVEAGAPFRAAKNCGLCLRGSGQRVLLTAAPALGAAHCTASSTSFKSSSESVGRTAMRAVSTVAAGCGSAGAGGRLSLPMNTSCSGWGSGWLCGG